MDPVSGQFENSAVNFGSLEIPTESNHWDNWFSDQFPRLRSNSSRVLCLVGKEKVIIPGTYGARKSVEEFRGSIIYSTVPPESTIEQVKAQSQ